MVDGTVPRLPLLQLVVHKPLVDLAEHPDGPGVVVLEAEDRGEGDKLGAILHPHCGDQARLVSILTAEYGPMRRKH